MGRLLLTNCQLQISLLACYFICLTSAKLTVEQRLQNLEATNVEIKQMLLAKNQRIEALETQVRQLKSIVTELQKERNVAKNEMATVNDQQLTGKNAIFRTCRETHLADPSLTSGLHWIDPDGQGVGDDPIQVYCSMATGITAVLHDNESPTDIGHCANPGCYSRSITYSATMRQMRVLAELSSECHQSFRYDCNYAPFETNGVVNSWWNDRMGNPQYFWAGSNSSVHTCQCGIENNCLESSMKCNCDSNLPSLESDNGFITNKDLLPITRLNFGRILLDTSFGVYTLGRFECSGQRIVNVGGAMNLTSGIFTAPQPGIYFFTFTGLIELYSSAGTKFGLDLVLNGNKVGISYVEMQEGSTMDRYTISLQSTLEMEAGDRVWLQSYNIANAFLADNVNHHTNFTGQLLQEDISLSLRQTL